MSASSSSEAEIVATKAEKEPDNTTKAKGKGKKKKAKKKKLDAAAPLVDKEVDSESRNTTTEPSDDAAATSRIQTKGKERAPSTSSDEGVAMGEARARYPFSNKRASADRYMELEDEDTARKIADRYIYQPEDWTEAYEPLAEEERKIRSDKTASPDMLKAQLMRLVIQEGTNNAGEDHEYLLPDGKTVEFPLPADATLENIQRAEKATLSDIKDESKLSRTHDTATHVIKNEDLLDTALWSRRKKKVRPMVVIESPKGNPGGHDIGGNDMYIDEVMRRTNLGEFLQHPNKYRDGDPMYPLGEGQAILCEDVTVFRKTQAEGYAFMKKPKLLSICVVSSVGDPLWSLNKRRGRRELKGGPAGVLDKKMQLVFKLAANNAFDSIFMGSLSSTSTNAPPEGVASQIYYTLARNTFDLDNPRNGGLFNEICFVIDEPAEEEWGTHNPNGDFGEYRKIFTKGQRDPYIVTCNLC